MEEHGTAGGGATEVVNPYGAAPGSSLPAVPAGWAEPGTAAWGTGAGPAEPPLAPRRRGIGAGGILAIVAGSLVLLLVVGGLSGAVGFLSGYVTGASSMEDSYFPIDEADTTTGIVVDEQGAEVPGIGTYESPARMGVHGLSWVVLSTGGNVTYRIESVDWDADAEVAAASPDNPEPPTGYRYALVTVSGTYTGPGYVDLAQELYLQIETDEDAFSADSTLANPPDPLWARGGITDGQSAEGQVLVEVRDDVTPDATLISVSTWDGELLYVDPS